MPDQTERGSALGEVQSVEVPVWSSADRVVVTLSPGTQQGAQEEGVPDLRFQLHDVILNGSRVIVVDASCLDALPSAAIAAMLTAHRVCRRRGGRVVIRHPSRRALDQLRRTGLWRVFQVESRSAAISCTPPLPSKTEP